jgi:putative hydrolase of the HAD superfamily
LLIIFDLDDTLIDTSGCITPVKLEKALHCMVAEGLELVDFGRALELLLRLDRKSESAKSALEEFMEINDFDPKFLPVALHEVYSSFSDEIPVFAVEDAVEVLAVLSYDHKMAIVSVGKPELQMWKLKKAGIDSSLFCKILVLEEKNKKKYYEALIQELNLSPSDVIVCGDRIPIDLLPAKQLGCKTIHMKKGRGLHSVGSEREVDFTITHLSQISKVLADISKTPNFN